jgi:hypothetical protein
MGEKTRQSASQTSRRPRNRWKLWLLRLLLVIWVLQLAWLGWQLREELGDVAGRAWHHSWGEAIRQEDSFSRWLAEIKPVIPPHATYFFLDNYEAGKEIEARYHLFPRRHLLFPPQITPSLLFHTLRQHQASYLLVRDVKQPPGPGLVAAKQAGVAERLPLPGPGLVFRVDPTLITGGFYD